MQHLHFWQRKPMRRRYYNNGIRINFSRWRYGRGVSYMLNTGKQKIKK